MKGSDLAVATIEEIGPLFAKKKLSRGECLAGYTDRLQTLNRRFNAFITVTAEQALAEAHIAERELARGKRRGPLHGVPIALKDNVFTRGIRTTMASAIARDFVPEQDATIVRKLRKA